MMTMLLDGQAWADRWLVGLVEFALRATVLLLVALLATRLLRNAAAAVRHLIWTGAVAGVLLLPLAAALLPQWTVPVVTVAAEVDRTAGAAAGRATPVASTREIPAPSRPAAQESVAEASLATAQDPDAPRPTWAMPDLSATEFAMGAWLVVAFLLLARLGVANARIASWRRAARPVEDAAALRLARRLAQQQGIARPVALLESDETDVPITWGVVYPVILLPASALQWDEEERVAVLMHELAHVKRFDAFTQQLAQVALGLLWFHPLMWLALRRLRLERERACDDVVLAAGARASRYADQLLAFARRLTGDAAPSVAALAMARRTELEGRLLAILDPAVKRTAVRGVRMVLAAATVAMLIPLAAFRPGVRVDTPKAADPASSFIAAPDTAARAMPGETPTAPFGAARMTTSSQRRTAPQVEVELRSLMPSMLSSGPSPHLAPLSRLAQRDTEPPSPVDRATLIAVTRAAGRMTGDYDKGQILRLVARRYVVDDSLRDAYLDVVATMSSDHERARALVELLARDTLTAHDTARLLRLTSGISSDYEKGQVLKRVSPLAIADSAAQRVYLAALGTMSSSVERSNAITALVKHARLPQPNQIALLRAASGISANVEKANALLAFYQHQGVDDPEVRRAFLSAAATLTSDVEYRRVITAVMR